MQLLLPSDGTRAQCRAPRRGPSGAAPLQHLRGALPLLLQAANCLAEREPRGPRARRPSRPATRRQRPGLGALPSAREPAAPAATATLYPILSPLLGEAQLRLALHVDADGLDRRLPSHRVREEPRHHLVPASVREHELFCVRKPTVVVVVGRVRTSVRISPVAPSFAGCTWPGGGHGVVRAGCQFRARCGMRHADRSPISTPGMSGSAGSKKRTGLPVSPQPERPRRSTHRAASAA